MKIGMMVMMIMLLNTGVTHAESVKPALGYDRVGLAASQTVPTANNIQAKTAPGEHADQALQARKREMARRLVWLMLSAR
tara:strand:+ start:288 stop:527 length:240 start_codon:yes stop_codon:yes gene_type:complete